MRTARRNAALLSGGAVLAALLLHRAGTGTLATPDRWTLDAWRALVLDRGAAVAALILVRLVALAACAWLAVLGTAGALLARSEHRLVRRWLQAATPRLLRPALCAVGALTLAAPSAHAADPASPPPVMVLVTTTTAPAAAANTVTSPQPTMRRLPDGPGGDVPAARTAGPSTAATTGPVPAAAPDGRSWTVARGDHFWHIAEATVGHHLGRAPRVTEVDAYWRRLVTANRDRLVDRDNPDLLFAGQEVLLPPL